MILPIAYVADCAWYSPEIGDESTLSEAQTVLTGLCKQ
jgi:hypothetical protein